MGQTARKQDLLAKQQQPAAASPAAARADRLSRQFEPLSARERLERALGGALPGPVALVSSFGAESAALLHMIAEIAPETPVLFLDTEMLFPETLAYHERLVERLRLRDVRRLSPDPALLAAVDPSQDLHGRDQDACCAVRKVRPLEDALRGFGASISGRKRRQAASRARLALVEAEPSGRLKLNPLADWSARQVAAYRLKAGLPAHPLVEKGFLSIGCAPCTTPVGEGEDARAGRWRGSEKTECGIHFIGGRPARRGL